MLPIRDNINSSIRPFMNWLIIALNVAIFFYQVSLDRPELEQVISTYGMIPERLNLDEPLSLLADPFVVITMVTSQFLHGGWLHLISNMWILYVFGDNIEDRMGHFRFLFFYVLGGIVANLLQAIVFPDSPIPAIGASGAVAAVLGGYIISFPRARVLTLIILFLFPWFVHIPAIVYLGFWFIAQLYSGLFALGGLEGPPAGGIAWWAHIGGFLFGLVMVNLFTFRKGGDVDR